MSVLEKIVDRRREDLPQLYRLLNSYGVSAQNALQCLALEPRELPRPRPLQDFRAALLRASRRPQGALILECKAASPSQGQLAADYHPEALARAYEPAAAAISVLCEPTNFHGSFQDLAAVSAAVEVPTLAKDFIIDPVQIALAYCAGADAVLLMLSVLDDITYQQLAAFAASLGLQALTEVLTPEEAVRATALGANLVDINHRNLHTLEIDLNRARDLAPLLGEDTVIVAASGMDNAAQIAQLRDTAHAFLVGSSLSGSADLGAALERLTGLAAEDLRAGGRNAEGEGAFPANGAVTAGDSGKAPRKAGALLKVCGLTTTAAAEACQKVGVDYGGLNLAKKSPRHVSDETAAQLIAAAPQLPYVAVTLASSAVELRELHNRLERITSLARGLCPTARGIVAVQLHCKPGGPAGEELLIGRAARILSGYELWRALPFDADAEIFADTVADPRVETLIVDSPKPGSGIQWDYRALPEQLRQSVVIAGGVGGDNAAAVVEAGFRGVDANSALEINGTNPPEKDPRLIAALAQSLGKEGRK